MPSKPSSNHWLAEDPSREPRNYDSAFYGFAKRYVKERA